MLCLEKETAHSWDCSTQIQGPCSALGSPRPSISGLVCHRYTGHHPPRIAGWCAEMTREAQGLLPEWWHPHLEVTVHAQLRSRRIFFYMVWWCVSGLPRTHPSSDWFPWLILFAHPQRWFPTRPLKLQSPTRGAPIHEAAGSSVHMGQETIIASTAAFPVVESKTIAAGVLPGAAGWNHTSLVSWSWRPFKEGAEALTKEKCPPKKRFGKCRCRSSERCPERALRTLPSNLVQPGRFQKHLFWGTSLDGHQDRSSCPQTSSAWVWLCDPPKWLGEGPQDVVVYVGQNLLHWSESLSVLCQRKAVLQVRTRLLGDHLSS